MKIKYIVLAKSPFDSNYNNVPSYPYGGDEALSQLPSILMHSSMMNSQFTIGEAYITPRAFCNNENEVIRVRVPEGSKYETYRNVNYMFIITEENEEIPCCYFITNIEALNALSKPTFEYTLTLDVWTTCYNTAYNEGSSMLITRKHLRMIPQEPEFFPEQYQNLYDGEVATIATVQPWANKKVLWAVFKCDPTISYYSWESTNTYTDIGHYAPSQEYGTYQYFYYPVAVINGSSLEKIRCGHRYGIYIPKVRVSALLSQQLTVHVPFTYSLNFDSTKQQYYVASPELVADPLFYKYASDKYYSLDANDTADPEAENPSTYFFYYTADSDTTVHSTSYSYQCIYSDNTDYGVTLPSTSPYCNAYPFHYYTLTLPNGKIVTFNQAQPLVHMNIKIIPTDSGGSYTVGASTANGTVLSYGGVYGNFEVTGDVPRSVSAYLEYMRRAGDAMIAQKEYEERTVATNLMSQTLSGAVQIGTGIAQTALGATASSLSGGTVGTGTTISGVSNIAGGAATLITADVNAASDAKYIKQKWAARASDLAKSTATTFQPSNQLNSAPYWGMPIITLYTPCYIPENIAVVTDFVKNGTECQIYDNPLSETRKYFTFTKAPTATYTSITNPRYRTIFESIVRQGTRMWNIANYPYTTLKYFIEGNDDK